MKISEKHYIQNILRRHLNYGDAIYDQAKSTAFLQKIG